MKTIETVQHVSKWQYKVIRSDFVDTAIAQILRNAGDDGWELVTCNESNARIQSNDGWLLIFKKPISI